MNHGLCCQCESACVDIIKEGPLYKRRLPWWLRSCGNNNNNGYNVKTDGNINNNNNVNNDYEAARPDLLDL